LWSRRNLLRGSANRRAISGFLVLDLESQKLVNGVKRFFVVSGYHYSCSARRFLKVPVKLILEPGHRFRSRNSRAMHEHRNVEITGRGQTCRRDQPGQRCPCLSSVMNPDHLPGGRRYRRVANSVGPYLSKRPEPRVVRRLEGDQTSTHRGPAWNLDFSRRQHFAVPVQP
jgi:hypothetical protein